MNPPADTNQRDAAAIVPVDEARAELLRSLRAHPRSVPPRWLYDDAGSELFDDITRLPEYYQTEAEREILAATSELIAEITTASSVIELGAGTSDKTRTLLDAFVAHGVIERFTPLDVSEATLLAASEMLRERYPGLAVDPVVGDFNRHLNRLPSGGRRLVVFLGGTIGNFHVEERAAFLGALADVLEPDDWIAVGIDLIKPLDRLVAAYDDSQGLTDAFIRNVLRVINREFDGNLDVGNFDYVPLWDPREERIDMRLRALEPESANIRSLGLDVDLEAGEELRVEISAKFRSERFVAELAEEGFVDASVFTDAAGDFAVVLARRSEE
jgi:L-histidine N-alpha-methyltransferase